MGKRIVRVVVVDDNEPWRRYICSTIQEQPELNIVAEVTDGLEAVHVAQQLQPDLILLDIGLPTLNGLEAARRIRQLSPYSKILFVSENRSQDIAEEALRTGAVGYVVKSAATTDLLLAVEAVLDGKQFVGASLTGPHTAHDPHRDNIVQFRSRPKSESPHHHEVGFYSDEQRFLDNFTEITAASLRSGNVTIVVATESHRNTLLARLEAEDLDIDAAIEQRRFVLLDAADTLSMYMVEGLPNPALFMQTFGNLIQTTASAAKGDHPRVAVIGEGVHLLWSQGNAEAAIQVEKLCNQLTHLYDLDVFCGYSLGSVQEGMDSHLFQLIRAEHSAVYFP